MPKYVDNSNLFGQLRNVVEMFGFTARRAEEEKIIQIEDRTGTVNFLTTAKTKLSKEEDLLFSKISFSVCVGRCTNWGSAEELEIFAHRLTSAAELIKRLNTLDISFVVAEGIFSN